jgi:hypothetical protein
VAIAPLEKAKGRLLGMGWLSHLEEVQGRSPIGELAELERRSQVESSDRSLLGEGNRTSHMKAIA